MNEVEISFVIPYPDIEVALHSTKFKETSDSP